jgi:predicted NodU family carbamoyl transferase
VHPQVRSGSPTLAHAQGCVQPGSGIVRHYGRTHEHTRNQRVPRRRIRGSRHENVAASLQWRLEDVVLGMLRELHARTRTDALCLASGVALNCVVNGTFDETPFRQVYVQPAAHDGGTSVGAAYHVWHDELGNPRDFV